MPDAASRHLDALIQQFDLERLDSDLFLGDAGKGEGRLFGGLVAAQSVVAAYRTVAAEDAALHSLHAYFLRPGRHNVPIRYVVYRIRDGRTFTTRDVVAYQAGEAIFNLSSSFTRPEPGASRQEPMPAVPDPDGLPEWQFVRARNDEQLRHSRRWQNSPIEMRACDDPREAPAEASPRRRVWMRVRGTLPEDPVVHAAMLTYASDRGLLQTARRGVEWMARPAMSASIDHAIWYHRPPRFDGWVLYTSESPVAHAARALIFAQMHAADGTRIASVAQEGLVRMGPTSDERESSDRPPK
ncbi:MAG TPA: acyl-CoA thioesterase II [Dehalococcoidia bacterium]